MTLVDDPEIAAVLEQELGRQRGTLEMIASETFVSRAILEALSDSTTEPIPQAAFQGAFGAPLPEKLRVES